MAEYSNTNEGTQHRFKKCCNAKALKKKIKPVKYNRADEIKTRKISKASRE